jgi:hypothetical protein
MAFNFLIKRANDNNLVYQINETEAFFVPIGKNYFTRVRNIGTDYYIEYCDDYKKPLMDSAHVIRRDEKMIEKECAANVIHLVIKHPKN